MTYFTHTSNLVQAAEREAQWLGQMEQSYQDWREAASKEGFLADRVLRAAADDFASPWRTD